LSWEKQRSRWLKGQIGTVESKDDVLNWLRNDPIWQFADKVDIDEDRSKKDGQKARTGSHCAKIWVRGIGQIIPKVSADVFDIAAEGGRHIKKWQIEVICKIYKVLEALNGK